MNNIVRNATLEDIPLLVSLMEQFYSEADFALDRLIAGNSFSTLLASSSLGTIWIVEQNGDAIGYAVLTVCFSMEHGGFVGFIDDLFVLPSHRRQGAGDSLIQGIMAECERRELRAIHVEVAENNSAAQALYRSRGLNIRLDDRQHLTMVIKVLPANP